jgi:hypothetical protein
MVGLGAAALSQVYLAVPFRALTRRIKTIDARVRAVQEMLTQEHRARLAKGLGDLRTAGEVERADPAAGREFTFAARNDLAGSRAPYAEQLAGQLAAPTPAGPAYLWMLARHLATAALGEAACHLRLGQPEQAAGVLQAAAGAVARQAAVVFGRTVGANPARYLIPANAGHGLTLEAMAELYRQAGHAGVVGDRPAATAAALFEGLRGRLWAAADPRFGKAAKVGRLRAEFAEAAAAVEEVNRLRGLALAVGAYHRPGRTYAELTAEILREVDARRPADGTYLAFFPDPAGAGPGAAGPDS